MDEALNFDTSKHVHIHLTQNYIRINIGCFCHKSMNLVIPTLWWMVVEIKQDTIFKINSKNPKNINLLHPLFPSLSCSVWRLRVYLSLMWFSDDDLILHLYKTLQNTNYTQDFYLQRHVVSGTSRCHSLSGEEIRLNRVNSKVPFYDILNRDNNIPEDCEAIEKSAGWALAVESTCPSFCKGTLLAQVSASKDKYTTIWQMNPYEGNSSWWWFHIPTAYEC